MTIATVPLTAEDLREQARAFRVLGLLVGCDPPRPILTALKSVAESKNRFSGVFHALYEGVREGDSGASILRSQDCVPVFVANFVDLGEEVGMYDQTYLEIADILQMQASLMEVNIPLMSREMTVLTHLRVLSWIATRRATDRAKDSLLWSLEGVFELFFRHFPDENSEKSTRLKEIVEKIKAKQGYNPADDNAVRRHAIVEEALSHERALLILACRCA